MEPSINSERQSLLNSIHINNEVPVDKYNAVYFIFTCLGIACLLPWNFFITAKDYFQYKLRNTSLPDGGNLTIDSTTQFETDDQRLFESYLSITAMVTNLLFMILTTMFIRNIPINIRVIVSLVITILVFSETTALVLIDSDKWQSVFFIVTMASAAVVMAATSVSLGSFIGLSCLFPVKYTQACMIGQAIGGTFSALAQIVSKAGNGGVLGSAFGYFMTATVFTVGSLLAFGSLYKLKFAKFYLSNQIGAQRNLSNEIPSYKEVVGYREYFTSIFKKIWQFSVCSFMTFFVTLACFPTICASIKPMHTIEGDAWTNDYFTPVVCFLLFNVGDCIGRTMTGWCSKPSPRHKYFLMFASLLRVVYIPLLMYCNAGSNRHLPVIFDHDAYPMIFIFTLGVSNGYLSTLCMMFAPMRVPIEQAEGAGVIMALALTIGLTVGSLFSLLFAKLL